MFSHHAANFVHHPLIQLFGLADCHLYRNQFTTWISDQDGEGDRMMVTVQWQSDEVVALLVDLMREPGLIESHIRALATPEALTLILVETGKQGWVWLKPFNSIDMEDRNQQLKSLLQVEATPHSVPPGEPKVVLFVDRAAGEKPWLNLVQDKPCDDGRYYKFLSKELPDGQVEGVLIQCWPNREIEISRKARPATEWNRKLAELNSSALSVLGAKWVSLD